VRLNCVEKHLYVCTVTLDFYTHLLRVYTDTHLFPDLQFTQFQAYATLEKLKKIKYHFYKRVGRVLGVVKAQRDEDGGRILLSDNTGGGMVMLLDSLVYKYIVDLRSLHSDGSTIRLVPDLPAYVREWLLLASSMNLSLRKSSTKPDLLLLSKNAVHTLYFKAVKSCSRLVSLLGF